MGHFGARSVQVVNTPRMDASSSQGTMRTHSQTVIRAQDQTDDLGAMRQQQYCATGFQILKMYNTCNSIILKNIYHLITALHSLNQVTGHALVQFCQKQAGPLITSH